MSGCVVTVDYIDGAREELVTNGEAGMAGRARRGMGLGVRLWSVNKKFGEACEGAIRNNVRMKAGMSENQCVSEKLMRQLTALFCRRPIISIRSHLRPVYKMATQAMNVNL